MELHYCVLQLGKKRPILAQTILLLPDLASPCTLTLLLEAIVAHQVQAYETRQASGPLLEALSAVQLDQGAQQGKIDFGERLNDQVVDLAKAQTTALQAFEDGLYTIFADDNQLTDLNASIDWASVTCFNFLRLTFLSGRRW